MFFAVFTTRAASTLGPVSASSLVLSALLEFEPNSSVEIRAGKYISYLGRSKQY
jgi:hypothetical protein